MFLYEREKRRKKTKCVCMFEEVCSHDKAMDSTCKGIKKKKKLRAEKKK